MTNTALVVVVLRHIAVRNAAGRFFGTIHPGYVADGFGRAGFHAFRIAVAEKALAGDVLFNVEAHHVPGAGFLAKAAADAGFFIDITGTGLRIDADGAFRAGVGAGNRVVALAAATVDTSKKPRRVISIGNLALDNSPLRSSILTPVVAKIESA